jgi:hypothetical protein
MRIAFFLAVLACAAACGGGGTTISGAVAGRSVTAVRGAYASQFPVPGSEGDFWLYVSISDSPAVCDAHIGNKEPKDSKTFFLELFATDDSGYADLAAGTYTIPPPTTPAPGKWGNAYFGDFSGEGCADTIGQAGVATAGTVKIDKLDLAGSATAGSFDVTFGSSKVTGSFVAPTCTGSPSFGQCYP